MSSQVQGRPRATTHAAIEECAMALFEARGFEETTLDDIAAAVGIGRRTLFRYYPSKNDILWGQFDASLLGFRTLLASTPPGTPLAEALLCGVIAFNDFDEAAVPQHRRRMSLLLRTPALLGHSELRYAAWRATVADFVAARTGTAPTEPGPQVAGRVTLALALSAYERWLADPASDLGTVIQDTFAAAASVLAPGND